MGADMNGGSSTLKKNWRLQGQGYFRIMAATGHRTLRLAKRDNLVNKHQIQILAGQIGNTIPRLMP
jgi:hypothetical protein